MNKNPKFSLPEAKNAVLEAEPKPKSKPYVAGKSSCFLETEHKQCCCNCIYHLPIHEHCETNPSLRVELGKCVCGIKTGWACVPPAESKRVFHNWPLHSIGCELYTPANP